MGQLGEYDTTELMCKTSAFKDNFCTGVCGDTCRQKFNYVNPILIFTIYCIKWV